MRAPLVAFAAGLTQLLLTGCTPHIYEFFDVDAGQSLSIDAKQRIILVTRKGGVGHDRPVVCAEPSPDALSATAAALSLQGGDAQAQAAISGAIKETAAYIGTRTPTIQLLRDGLYRACEGYLNGVINSDEYSVILRNYDRVMVALMEIDAVAGTPVAPSLTLASGDAQAPPPGAASPKPPAGAAAASATGISGSSLAPAAAAQPQSPAAPPAGSPAVAKPANGTTAVLLGPSIEHGDQVLKTIADYMLNNDKWLVAVCLSELDALARPQKKNSDEMAGDPQAERDAEAACKTVLNSVRSIGKGRDFASDGSAGTVAIKAATSTSRAARP